MKKTSLIKLVSLLLSAALLLPLAACSEPAEQTPATTTGQSTGNAVTTKEVSWNILENVDESFPLDEYIQDEKDKWYLGREAVLDWWFQFPWKQFNESFAEYEALMTILEITGVDVEARISVGDAMEAMNLMMATNDFPDLMSMDPAHPAVQMLVNGGFISSIDELAAKFEPGFLEECPQVVKQAGTIGDTFWGIVGVTVPEWKYAGEDPIDLGNQSYNVRHDLWVEMGKPSIATPDDLYNTLKLFKEKYPTLGGKESIGMVGYGNAADGTLLTIGYSFGLKQDISVNTQDDSVTTRYLDPNYEAFVTYMNKLAREGLLDPEFFVKDVQQQMESCATNAFMMPWVWHALDTANTALKAQDPESVFIAIPPMSATGEEFSFRGSSTLGGASMTLIPKKSKDAEAAMRLIRYGLSPAGSLQMYRGNPGSHYVVNSGIFDQSEAVKNAALSGNWADWNKTVGIGDYYHFYCSPMEETYNYDKLRMEYDVPNSWKYSYDGTNELNGMTPDSLSDAGIAFTTIQSLGSRMTALAIMATTPEESASILKEMQASIRTTKDLDKLEEFWTSQYRSNIDTFGEGKW